MRVGCSCWHPGRWVVLVVGPVAAWQPGRNLAALSEASVVWRTQPPRLLLRAPHHAAAAAAASRSTRAARRSRTRNLAVAHAAADFAPTVQQKRTFGTVDFAALWVTLVISTTTYYLAASLVDMGGPPRRTFCGCCRRVQLHPGPRPGLQR
jgi:hypothetical protein